MAPLLATVLILSSGQIGDRPEKPQQSSAQKSTTQKSATQKSTQKNAELRARELVRQLGEDSFELRKKAAAELLELGAVAEVAVQEGISSSDPEVQARCRELYPQIRNAARAARVASFLKDTEDRQDHGLAGWKVFREVVGRDPPARALFLRLQSAEPELLEIAERDPNKAQSTITTQVEAVPLYLITPGNEDKAVTKLGLLLLLTLEKQQKTEIPRAPLHKALNMVAERQAWKKDWVSDPALVRLTNLWLQRDPDVAGALLVAESLKLPGTEEWAVRVFKDSKVAASTRGRALLVLAQAGPRAKEYLPAVEVLLNDTTSVGSRNLGGTKLEAELRDVALATALRLRGQDPATFGFPYLKSIPGLTVLPTPACLGFASPAERVAAFTAFAKWQQK